MNYFEFKKILDADPYSKDPEFLQAKNDDIRCKRAFKEAMANEQIIIDALNIPVPRHDIAHIKFNQTQIKQNSIRNNYFAAAASLLLLFGAGVFFITNTQNSDLEKFINDALMMEPAVYMSDAEIPQDKLAPLFASINTAVEGNLGKVYFMKLCPTLNGKGARMVVMNELNQPITVLYMPNSPVDQAINMQMEGFTGKIVALEQGSAAIIARPHQNIAQVENSLVNALKPIL